MVFEQCVPMKNEYDFSHGRRGAPLSSVGKTRVTICLDNRTLQQFKTESERTGKGYQTLINEALSQYRAKSEDSRHSEGS
jgi:uncharacterized protein (DUF4415 family)